MIKNPKQAGITKDRLAELKKAKEEIEIELGFKDESESKLAMTSFNNLIGDLENQLETYTNLRKGNFHCFKPQSLLEISDVLIGARIAQDMSHKALAEEVGVKEQQIQRYEATDYQTASWPKIMEIAEALNLKFYFEKILIINPNRNDNTFLIPEGISEEQILATSEKIRDRHSLIFN